MAENEGSKWWSKDTVVVVTGSCRGIGREIIRQLANAGMTVVLTDMSSAESIQASVEALKAELKLQSVNSGLNSVPGVFWHPLDIRSDKSVEDLANWLKKEFGGIDILVNNAGILETEDGYEIAKNVIDTNFRGQKRVTEALLPLMKRTTTGGARIISVTSRYGTYERLKNESAKKKLSDVKHLSEEVLENLALEYLEDVKADRLEERGWITNSMSTGPYYSVAKMLLSAYVQILASSVLSDGKPGAILVAAMCPSATATALLDDETIRKRVPSGYKIKTVEDGADTAVWLALLPKEGYPHGKFFGERQEYPYELKVNF